MIYGNWSWHLLKTEILDTGDGGEEQSDPMGEGEEFLKLWSRLPFLQTSVLIKVADISSNLFAFLNLFYSQPS